MKGERCSNMYNFLFYWQWGQFRKLKKIKHVKEFSEKKDINSM